MKIRTQSAYVMDYPVIIAFPEMINTVLDQTDQAKLNDFWQKMITIHPCINDYIILWFHTVHGFDKTNWYKENEIDSLFFLEINRIW